MNADRTQRDDDGASGGRAPVEAPLTTRVWRSKLGVLGVVVTTASGSLLVLAVLQELLLGGMGAYSGMVTYTALPALFVAGLLMMPLGLWLQRRRARRGAQGASPALVLDLTNPRHQRLLVFVSGMSVVNLALLSVVGYQAYHFTESVPFCGTLCHEVMEPEYTAYQRSPHARVTCAECHIGTGASWFVKSKLSGLRQVYGVLSGDHSRPVPTPIHNLRPARETCEQCHWPQVFHGTRPKVFYHYTDDGEVADPEVSAVMLHVGGLDARSGAYRGIHWHVSQANQVLYRSVDDRRSQVREVKVVRPDGRETLFVRQDLPTLPADAEWRPMDCVDCHNRPTHIYETAEEAVDRLIHTGALDATLPAYRSQALAAIQVAYPDREAARAGIREHLQRYYRDHHAEVATARAAAIDAQARVLFEQAWALNVFPAMKVTWGTYPSQLGHRGDGGCFRCHDDQHAAADGTTIAQDCDQCHDLMVQEQKLSTIDENVRKILF